jgi:AraC-like DNA-binding protein/mannose-6-phosphate isomerase-like protein (cupin superfamily)
MKNIKFTDQFLNKKMVKIDESLNISSYSTTIKEFGYFPQAKYHYIKRDKGVNEHILIICTQGEGTVIFNNKTYNLKPLTNIIIPKNTPHIYYSNNDNPWTIYWCHFNKDLINHINGVSSISALKYYCIISAFNNILNIENPEPENFNYLNLNCEYIIETLLYEDKKKIINIYIEQAINYMKAHILDDISLIDILDNVKLSKSQLNLLFNKYMNLSPISYYNKLKMEHASELLVMTKLSIADIASRLSISDSFYFSRMFKKYMGVSPKNFRKLQ